MDKELLRKYFTELGYEIEFVNFSQLNFREVNYKNKFILYTSSEDNKLIYKSYIDDILYGLFLQGANLLPAYSYFKAHSNKVFMEILRDTSSIEEIKNIRSYYYGTFEEMKEKLTDYNDNIVIKPSSGAMSKGVKLATNNKDLHKFAKRISRSSTSLLDFKDYLRFLKHKNYVRESLHRNKFIIQNFIKDIKNDWKVLIFGKKYYILCRSNRKNDFRASGSGKFKFTEKFSYLILDFAKIIYSDFKVPNLSIDVIFDGQICYLIEFQAVNFGSTTIEKSPFYFTQRNSKWIINKKETVLEEEYAKSVDYYLKRYSC